MNQHDRFIRVRNVLLCVLILNWAVALLKIVYGIVTRVASMSADGMHSFSDGASNVIGLIGIWAASQPVDAGHPYGHKKYETFSAIGIAILLILVCAGILHDAAGRLVRTVAPEVTVTSFLIMMVTLAINAFVIWYETKKSRELKSDLLYSDAMHTRSDILVSLSVIGTLISITMGAPFVDAVVAVIIAVLIGYSAFKILKECSNVLCDKAVPVSDTIRTIVEGISGVKECHSIRTRGRADDIHADLHVLVNAAMHVGMAHNISEVIEKEIKEKVPGVTDVIVHIEPR